MLVCDPWILDLAVQGPAHRDVAAKLMRCQVRTFKQTGHAMSFGDPYVRNRITVQAARSQVSAVPVYCSRCGCGAQLGAWIAADNYRNSGTDVPHPTLRSRDGVAATEYMRACTGDKVAIGIAAILEPTLAKEMEKDSGKQ